MSGASGDAYEPQDVKISGANLHLIRGGEPLDPESLRAHASSYAAEYLAKCPPREYVDNHSNVVQKRVGKAIDETLTFDLCDSIEDVLRKLRADPFEEQWMDLERAKAAADIYAREIAEYEQRGHVLGTNGLAIAGRLVGPVSSSDLVLHHQIGGGGFGSIFLGNLFGEVVAVKKKAQAADLRSRYIEILAAKHLYHPNIVGFLCICGDPSSPFIVMEYMEMSLWQAKDRQVQMKDDVKLDLMAQMWRGLDYLHKKDVAHCDVTAANVLLANVGHGGKGIIAKLSDFGSAVFQYPGQDEKLNLKVSLRYAAPEILRGEPFDVAGLKAADVYSMAVTCFVLSTELMPFNNCFMEQCVLEARIGGQADLRPSDGAYPRFGRHACLERCWEVEAEARPSAEEMVAELEGLSSTGASIFEE